VLLLIWAVADATASSLYVWPFSFQLGLAPRELLPPLHDDVAAVRQAHP
jgi:hypothetical protein